MPTINELIEKRYRALAAELEQCEFGIRDIARDKGDGEPSPATFSVVGTHDGAAFRLEAMGPRSAVGSSLHPPVRSTVLTLLDDSVSLEVAITEKPIWGSGFFLRPNTLMVPGWSVSEDRLIGVVDEDHLSALVSSSRFEEAISSFDWHAVAAMELVPSQGITVRFPTETSYKVDEAWLTRRLADLRRVAESIAELKPRPEWTGYLRDMRSQKKIMVRRIAIASAIAGVAAAIAVVFLFHPNGPREKVTFFRLLFLGAGGAGALVGWMGRSIAEWTIHRRARKKIEKLRQGRSESEKDV